jgi:Fic family protein
VPGAGRSPLICRPERKAELEARNAVSQLDYIAHLVNERRIGEIRESYIQRLHALAVEDIYPCGGEYRNATKYVTIEGSRHRPPHESLVRPLVWDLIYQANHPRAHWRYIQSAAYVIWRLNWIHPFAGGNGRTARALGYLVVCIDFGTTLPGVPSVPTLLARHRDEYLRGLWTSDKAHGRGRTNVHRVARLVRRIVRQQLSAGARAEGAA